MLGVRLRLNSLEEVERWVLSWGTHAKVDVPLVLRELSFFWSQVENVRFTTNVSNPAWPFVRAPGLWGPCAP
jgi:hypothetical protein